VVKRIRIVQILEATAGGTRRHLYDLVTHLDPAAFEVSVIASTGREPGFAGDMEAFAAQGIRTAVVHMPRAVRPAADRRALGELRRLLGEWRPEVVHTHSSKAGFLGRLAARQAGVPASLYTPHCFAFEMEVCGLRKWLYARLERHAARWCRRLVCVCDHERRQALARRIADPAQLVVIENGVAPVPPASPIPREALGLSAAHCVVGLVGRLSPQKGHEAFLDAAARAVRTHPQLRFVFLGDGDRRPAIERKIGALGLRTRCVLLGQRDNARAYYGCFDLVALPSRWEALPYTLLDAMAAGRPVVATAVGGLADVVHETGCGEVVPLDDAEAMAAALGSLAGDAARRQELGGRGRAAVSGRFRLDSMVEKLSAVYRQCVD